MADLDTKTEYIPKIVREMMMPSSLNVFESDRKSRYEYMLKHHKDLCSLACCSECCGCETYEQGVKSFAEFLIDKGIDRFEMTDLVKEFLEKGE